MKKFISVIAILALLVSPAFGAWDKTKPANNEKFVDTPAQIRANWDAIELGTDAALQITNAKVAASAAIADTKLAQITTVGKVSGAALTLLANVPAGAGALPIANIPTISTAGKVDGAALTGFANIPSGAGTIPVANIDTGTTANKIVKLDDTGKLPAVDGSALTGLSAVPTGVIMAWSAAAAPTGYVLCDGASYLREGTYAALFAVIGTTYGAADGTHFNVPNMKGKAIAGYNSAETEFDTLGETGGAKTHTLSTSEMPAHAHQERAVTSGGSSIDAVVGTTGAMAQPTVAAQNYSYNNGGGAVPALNTASSGGDGAHNNLQPYITVNYIIKT